MLPFHYEYYRMNIIKFTPTHSDEGASLAFVVEPGIDEIVINQIGTVVNCEESHSILLFQVL